MRMRMSPVHGALLRAVRARLGALAGAAEPALVVEGFESAPWASLTFSGERHELMLRVEGDVAEVEAFEAGLRAWLAEPELEPCGHFLADAELSALVRERVSDTRMSLGLRLQALTISE